MSIARYVQPRGASPAHATMIALRAMEDENETIANGGKGWLEVVGRDDLDGALVFGVFDLGVWWDLVGFDMWRALDPRAADAYMSNARRTARGPNASGKYEVFDPAKGALCMLGDHEANGENLPSKAAGPCGLRLTECVLRIPEFERIEAAEAQGGEEVVHSRRGQRLKFHTSA